MPVSLPQPPSTDNGADPHPPYRYLPYDVLEANWLGDPRRLEQAFLGKGADVRGRYAPGALAWVLLSKGKPKQPNRGQSGYNAQMLHKKRRDKKNKRKNVGCDNPSGGNDDGGVGSETTGNGTKVQETGKDANINTTTQPAETTMVHNHSRKEFFLRARVVSDDEPLPTNDGGDDAPHPLAKQWGERRILVRYSRGATYRVRAYNLVPVLEPSVHTAAAASPSLPPLVVLVPETNIYRRVAKVHTTPDDSFVEVGCDYGITCDKVRQSLEEAGDVPKEWPVEEKNDGSSDSNDLHEAKKAEQHRVLGIDRSKESIDIAHERYPQCQFALGNVLVPEEMASLRALCERTLAGGAPSVICIDINGNREIEGVLECLQRVMDEPWRRRPRMIVVKSRFLYWELKKMRGEMIGDN